VVLKRIQQLKTIVQREVDAALVDNQRKEAIVVEWLKRE
jgi:hypothetical protein